MDWNWPQLGGVSVDHRAWNPNQIAKSSICYLKSILLSLYFMTGWSNQIVCNKLHFIVRLIELMCFKPIFSNILSKISKTHLYMTSFTLLKSSYLPYDWLCFCTASLVRWIILFPGSSKLNSSEEVRMYPSLYQYPLRHPLTVVIKM